MYRERSGVVRMAVGRLSFTPEQLRDNVKAYVNAVKKDAANLSDQIVKQISEVVGAEVFSSWSHADEIAGFELDELPRLFAQWRILQTCPWGTDSAGIISGLNTRL